MRKAATYLALVLAILLTGCNGGNKLTGFWDDVDVTVTEDNYSDTQDRFAQFAELLACAPAAKADVALESLFGKIKQNEVDYIIYSQWMESAFHNYFSPYRNPRLFGKAVEHFAADGVLAPEELERLQTLAAQDQLNRQGGPCTVPDEAKTEGPTLYLVLNLDCRTCLQSLAALSGEYPEAEHIALCFGYNQIPEVSGWKYLKPEGLDEIFELEAAPFWFLTAADGTIQIPYSGEFNAPGFANPQDL